MAELIHKNVGETPLEALEGFRADKILRAQTDIEAGYWRKEILTYAGRLDPMAEGKLLILIGDECKEKEKYLGLDKEYEVEIVLGLETDTYDALGLIEVKPTHDVEVGHMQGIDANIDVVWLQRYAGKFIQPYPPYSSKTVDGKQLHELARVGDLPDDMPTKEVEIYSIELLNKGMIAADELLDRIIRNISLVKGDFRQEQIQKKWREVLITNPSNNGRIDFPVIRMRVKCSSGTYMRSLAHRIGKDVGIGAFAIAINRTKIGRGDERIRTY